MADEEPGGEPPVVRPQDVLRDLAEHVSFDPATEAMLAELGPVLRPAFPGIARRFYEVIAEATRAAQKLTGDPPRLRALEGALEAWVGGLFSGVHDTAYFERCERIGRAHARVGLPQRTMLGGMTIVRRELHAALFDSGFAAERMRDAHAAIDVACDLDLVLLLEAHRSAEVRQARVSERFATLGLLAASIGHDLRNPLAVIETSIHLLGKRLSGDAHAERHLRRIREQVVLSGSIISDLLELARDAPPVRRPTSIPDLVEEALSGAPLRDTVDIISDVPADLPAAEVDAGQLRQVLVNLLLNAMQAVHAGGGGRVRVAAGRADDVLVLTVEDDGPGLSEEVMDKVFEPLFTTRKDGTGLGLALCQRVVSKHGGYIAATNRSAGGARFEVRLPGAFP